MRNQRSNHFLTKATAVLSAIAAASVLGLPAFAQTETINNTRPTTTNYPAPGSNSGTMMDSNSQRQNMNNAGQTNSDCPPGMVRSQASSENPGVAASTSGTNQFPNQADPRTGAVPSQSTETGANAATPVTQPSVSQSSTMQGSMNQSSMNRGERSSSDRRIVSAPGSRAAAVRVGDVLSSGGATTGGESRQLLIAAGGGYEMNRSSDNQSASNQMTNNTASGAATTGGESRQVVLGEPTRTEMQSSNTSQMERNSSLQAANCVPQSNNSTPSRQSDTMNSPAQSNPDRSTTDTNQQRSPGSAYDGQAAPRVENSTGTFQNNSR